MNFVRYVLCIAGWRVYERRIRRRARPVGIVGLGAQGGNRGEAEESIYARVFRFVVALELLTVDVVILVALDATILLLHRDLCSGTASRRRRERSNGDSD